MFSKEEKEKIYTLHSMNLLLLGTLSGQQAIRSKDFTDDRLEQALDYLSKPDNWLKVSNELNLGRKTGLCFVDDPIVQHRKKH